jgi:hypothetical protein
MPLASKINIVAYVGTYYAIAAAWILTLANYFIIGWFKGCKFPKLNISHVHFQDTH